MPKREDYSVLHHLSKNTFYLLYSLPSYDKYVLYILTKQELILTDYVLVLPSLYKWCLLILLARVNCLFNIYFAVIPFFDLTHMLTLVSSTAVCSRLDLWIQVFCLGGATMGGPCGSMLKTLDLKMSTGCKKGLFEKDC